MLKIVCSNCVKKEECDDVGIVCKNFSDNDHCPSEFGYSVELELSCTGHNCNECWKNCITLEGLIK